MMVILHSKDFFFDCDEDERKSAFAVVVSHCLKINKKVSNLLFSVDLYLVSYAMIEEKYKEILEYDNRIFKDYEVAKLNAT